jgi:hypothetical protein
LLVGQYRGRCWSSGSRYASAPGLSFCSVMGPSTRRLGRGRRGGRSCRGTTESDEKMVRAALMARGRATALDISRERSSAPPFTVADEATRRKVRV